MIEENQTYIEKQLDAKFKSEKEQIVLTFQREKIKLDDEIEIKLLSELNPFIRKEFCSTEDELVFTFYIESNHSTFNQLINVDEKSQWIFASQLLKKIMSHSSNRLHLIVCPENILIDESFTPYFLHYGVKESIPPYERNDTRIWKETKAIIAAIVDNQYSFEQYMQFSKSIQLSPIVEEILQTKNENELLKCIQNQIKAIEKKEKSFTKITLNKWYWVRNSFITLGVILVPLIIYLFYAVFIVQPREKTFINVQEPFIQEDYSEIVDQLSKIKVEDMPHVVQYELATAYIMNVDLIDEQKKNILKTITVQTDYRYFQYWIYIGRGEAKEALAIARQLDELDYILLSLLEYEKQVKADQDMKAEEREKLLNEIESEKEKYENQKKELDKEQEDSSAIENVDGSNSQTSEGQNGENKEETSTKSEEIKTETEKE